MFVPQYKAYYNYIPLHDFHLFNSANCWILARASSVLGRFKRTFVINQLDMLTPKLCSQKIILFHCILEQT